MQPTIATVFVVLLVTAIQTYGYVNPWHLLVTSALALVYHLCRYLMSNSDSDNSSSSTTRPVSTATGSSTGTVPTHTCIYTSCRVCGISRR